MKTTPKQHREEVHKAMEIADFLVDTKGRVFRVTTWSPTAEVGSVLTVEVRAIICVPETELSQEEKNTLQTLRDRTSPIQSI